MNLKKLIEKNIYIEDSVEFDKHLLKIPIKECGEGFASLVDLARKNNVKIVFDTNSDKLFYLRESPAISVINSARILQEMGYILKVEYAYRSISQQKALFNKRVKEVEKQHPNLSKKHIFQIANMYTAGVLKLAAHINMGCDYREGKPEATTNYPKLTKKASKLRKILCEIMESQGLTNYPFEYWHFSMGDVCATYLRGKNNAIYGPVEFSP